MEEELGAPLFDRIGRGLVLTAAGRALVPRARDLLEGVLAATLDVSKAAKRGYYDVRIDAVDSVASYLVPPLVRPLREAFPELLLKLRTGRSAQLLPQVQAGQLDLAFVAWSGPPPGERVFRMGPYRLQFFGRRDTFADLAAVRRDDELKRFPIVEIEALPGQPTLIAEDAPTFAVAHSLASVKALVLAGFGIGAMLPFMLDDHESGQLVCADLPHDPNCSVYAVAGPLRSDPHAAVLESAILAAMRRQLEAGQP